MDTEGIIGVISAIVAIIAALISIRTLNVSKRIARFQINAHMIYEAEKIFLENPNLLELHNVDTAILTNNNITIEEFVYILASFRAGSAYYAIAGSKEKMPSAYRRNLLDNRKVRIVYEQL